MGIDSCACSSPPSTTEEGQERLNFLLLDDRIPAGAKLY